MILSLNERKGLSIQNHQVVTHQSYLGGPHPQLNFNSRTTRQLKQRDPLTELRLVRALWHNIMPLVTDQITTPFRIETPEIDIARVADIRHALLAALARQTDARAPILEEVVQAGTVHEYVTGIDDPQAPGARTVGLAAVREGRV